MVDVKGGYLRPTVTPDVSCSWSCHRNRNPSSTEPGTDFACAYGSQLVAPEDGVVVDTKHTTFTATGRYVTIDLDDGRRVRLLHLASIQVGKGQRVVRGQNVAKSGASGFGKEWGYGAHVHVTLWDSHSYRYGRDATMDFFLQIGADNDGGPTFNQTVANQQNFLNTAQGEKLVVDGLLGDNTRAAFKRYQQYLKNRGWYTGIIDGVWGDGTQSAHAKRYAEWAKGHAAPSAQYHNVTLNDIKSIGDVRGLQKIARLYGYKGGIDNAWGDGSKAGFQKFLNQNAGGSLASWLRNRWGYVGNDQFGPVMKAALQRANAENYKAL